MASKVSLGGHWAGEGAGRLREGASEPLTRAVALCAGGRVELVLHP